jgi:alpha-tubulin suppressor-like RCC1 family protein
MRNRAERVQGAVRRWVAAGMVAAVAGMLLGAACPQAQADGTVWAWGGNAHGQLGDGSNTDRWTPGMVTMPIPVVAVAGGGHHSLALAADGTVWAWGSNYYGQLGDGTAIDRQSPVQVFGLANVIAVAGGGVHSLALRADGSVWTWGHNWDGRLGDGTNTDRWTPVRVIGLTGVAAIAGGVSHSLALKSDGTTWAWGGNSGGNLGDGTTENRWTPVQTVGLVSITSIAAGYSHSLAVTFDGAVWAWGSNGTGQLGDGTTETRLTPVEVSSLNGVVAVAGGTAHSLALRSDGTVWAWGYNNDGALGDGTQTAHPTPNQVPGLAGVKAIAGGYTQSLALKTDGTVWAWGYGLDGQLGDGTNEYRYTPVQTTGLVGAVAIASSGKHSLALRVPSATALYVVDRTGTVTDPVRLKAYLKRTTDNAWVAGRGITFGIGGTDVGAGATDASGMAHLDWVIADGQGTRAITARFGGDPSYAPSTGTASLTALTHDTSLYVPNRSAEIADAVLLKAYLYWGPLHLPKLGKTVSFSVAGTAVGSAVTNEGGRAMLSYSVPEGAGPGLRSLVADWPGDGGYRASSATATLDVAKAPTYLWLASRSAQITKQTYLRAYLRRLPDYVWLPGKAVRFALDGTALGSEATDSGGRASYLYTVSAALGDHPMGAAFDGDGSYLPGGSTGVLTVVP